MGGLLLFRMTSSFQSFYLSISTFGVNRGKQGRSEEDSDGFLSEPFYPRSSLTDYCFLTSEFPRIPSGQRNLSNDVSKNVEDGLSKAA